MQRNKKNRMKPKSGETPTVKWESEKKESWKNAKKRKKTQDKRAKSDIKRMQSWG